MSFSGQQAYLLFAGTKYTMPTVNNIQQERNITASHDAVNKKAEFLTAYFFVMAFLALTIFGALFVYCIVEKGNTLKKKLKKRRFRPVTIVRRFTSIKAHNNQELLTVRVIDPAVPITVA